MSETFLKISELDNIGIVTLNKAHKRNALDECAIAEIDAYFSNVPRHIRAILMTAEGDHFCAGLDLREHHDKERTAVDFLRVCQGWHRAFDKIQHGGIPVIACLQGAVVGGGLELASAAHVRVADKSTFFALPEGTRGIFTGGGATVRTAKIISPSRMVELMLTGRVLDAVEGERLGLAHYVCNTEANPRSAYDLGLELARRIAGNAVLSNYAIVTSIDRISDMAATEGLFAEGLMAAVVQTGRDVQSRLGEFVNKKAYKVQPNS
ncbi:crotonase/enoyl-CoA hydratase family protein [Thauera sp. Sel9]|uniref:crotonase/enoyl-CoA hydratase family protein n=1 Tax=Thauera sp. Sel9 TaxID=2974299 RepID=UPI0021E109E7|nr:crotonase/enoyl-CoA hydratase family protein [Thauera sp. Sel9]MCV2218712.1 crotonase/enoyl-CoA hydratase family protein [Thauera sp. Sel9]